MKNEPGDHNTGTRVSDRLKNKEIILEATKRTTASSRKENEIRAECCRDDSEWDDLVDASEAGLIFHRTRFLNEMSVESRMSLRKLSIRQGTRVIGLFPFFIKKAGFFRFAFSPPPGLSVPNLGPVPTVANTHQADRERVEGEVAEAVTRYIRDEEKVCFIRFSTGWTKFDIRPYVWRDYVARPACTYSIDLRQGVEMAFQGFKKQLRTDARRAAQYEDLRLIEGDAEIYQRIVHLTRNRYREQGENWQPSDAYLMNVFSGVNDENARIRCWAVFSGNELITGLVVTFFKGVAAHWLGGVRYEAPYIGLNEWLHRTVMEEALSAGCHTYELIGGNTERLCRHKSRYNPNPEVYFNVERRFGAGGVVSRLLEVKGVKTVLKRIR